MKVFTDGSFSSSTPHVAGVGVHFPDQEFKDISQAFYDRPTSQRAELWAVWLAIQTIRAMTQDNIEIYSDSKYTIQSCTQWIHKWNKNGWKTAKGQPVLNQDILVPLSQCLQNVSFYHVSAHTHQQDPVSKANDQADKLAKKAIKDMLKNETRHSATPLQIDQTSSHVVQPK
jgi:ribonuclease HI